MGGQKNLRWAGNLLLVFVLSVLPFLFVKKVWAVQNRPTYCALASLDMMRIEDRPVFSVKYYGAKGDGVTDDTAAIQKAFDETPSGAVLEFPEGTYLHAKSLMLSKNGTILTGKGGVLKATNPDDQTIILKGDKAAVIGMTLKGLGTKRSSQPLATKILVKGRWNQILNNEIDGGASAGIFVYGGKDFRVVGNVVHETLADGIHMTNGARRGIVENNQVYETGDDKIAVVSYGAKEGTSRKAESLSGDILIRNNKVWSGKARGISVVGGENVVIMNNEVSDIERCGGILIAQEESYHTHGVNAVLVKNNVVNNIQMRPLQQGQSYTHHGAIDVNTSNQRPVGNIVIEDNTVNNARFSGVRVIGNACDIAIRGNRLNGTLGKKSEPPIHILRNDCAPKRLSCPNNLADGKNITLPDAQCYREATTEAKGGRFDYKALENIVWARCGRGD